MIVRNFDGSPIRDPEGGVLIPAGRLPPKYRKGSHVIQLKFPSSRELSVRPFAPEAAKTAKGNGHHGWADLIGDGPRHRFYAVLHQGPVEGRWTRSESVS
jgi:hypothetical protein